MSVERAARFVEHASRYAELGWALIPLDGKKPKPKGWEVTEPDAPQLAAGKWSQWGAQWNMGCVLGTSGLAVVEYDTEAAAARLRELLEGKRPRTPTARTGRGRLHLYFDDEGASAAKRDGLELRAGGQQCVVPPSVHPDTGVEYEWLEGLEPWSVELATVPRAVLDYFAESRTQGRAAPVADEIREGRRNDELASIAGTMRRRGLGEAEITAALLETNRLRCHPPLPEDEVRGIATSVARYPPAPSTTGVPGPGDPAPGAGSTEPSGDESQRSFPGLSHAEALARTVPPTSELVDGIAEVGTVGTIAGLPETYKSFLALDLGLRVASGGRVLGRAVRRTGAVAYWWQDDSEANELRRIQAFAGAHELTGELPVRWHLNEGLKLPDHLDYLVEEIERERQVLVVLDSLYNFLNGQVLKEEEVAKLYALLKRAVCDRTGCAVAVVDHAPWPSESNRGQRRAYGSVFKAAAIRWSIFLERQGEKLWVQAGGNNLGGLKRSIVEFDTDTLELRLVATPEAGSRDVAAEIAEYLADNPGATKTEITRAIGARAETVSAVLDADERFAAASAKLYGKPANATCWVLSADAANLFRDPGKGSEAVGCGGRSQPLPDDPFPLVEGGSSGKGLGTPLPDAGKGSGAAGDLEWR